jgi:hypothetical protein
MLDKITIDSFMHVDGVIDVNFIIVDYVACLDAWLIDEVQKIIREI